MAISPDLRKAAVSTTSARIHLVEIPSGRELADFRGDTKTFFHASFSPDGRRLATAGGSGIVKVWDVTVAQPRELAKFPLYHWNAALVEFLPNGTDLVSFGMKPGTFEKLVTLRAGPL